MALLSEDHPHAGWGHLPAEGWGIVAPFPAPLWRCNYLRDQSVTGRARAAEPHISRAPRP